MASLIDHLNGLAGSYTGSGDGSESGPFDATLECTPLLGMLGTAIHYRAIAPDGGLLHEEQTTLALDMVSGQPTLFVLCAELSGIGQLTEIGHGRFDNGAGVEGFHLQIEIGIEANRLDYVWSWAPPGDELAEQSRATFELAS